MRIERKDIRGKLDADVHAQFKAICDVDDVDMGDFIEALLLPVIAKRVHDAIELATRLQRLGTSGNNRERPGISGSARE